MHRNLKYVMEVRHTFSQPYLKKSALIQNILALFLTKHLALELGRGLKNLMKDETQYRESVLSVTGMT